MGHVFALSGCSGAGKTTFVTELFRSNPSDLLLLVRSTTRAIRKFERDGIDYEYLSKEEFRERLLRNEFVCVEELGGDYFAVSRRSIEDAIASKNDSVIMAGRRATELKGLYGSLVTLLFLHTSEASTLLHGNCLDIGSPANTELIRRLNEKIRRGVFELDDYSDETQESFVQRRMEQNLWDLAFFAGKMRAGQDFVLIENPRGRLNEALRQFQTLRQERTR